MRWWSQWPTVNEARGRSKLKRERKHSVEDPKKREASMKLRHRFFRESKMVKQHGELLHFLRQGKEKEIEGK